MRKYRVNESELFNLNSMYDLLQCRLCETKGKEWSDTVERLNEVENLLDKAPYIGAEVDWNTLKRIREIRDERNLIRYTVALENGATDREAESAFM